MTSPLFSHDPVGSVRRDPAVLPFLSDHEFETAYPEHVRNLSPHHWSPVEACRAAAAFLAPDRETRVLDIGCGPGKFCAIGAAATGGHFTGVEQREFLVSAAGGMIRHYGLRNVRVIHGNVCGIDFRRFDAFYLFNPFEENVYPSLRIDLEVELTRGLYNCYTEYVRRNLALAPSATRVATYCGDCDEIPDCYDCVEIGFGGRMKYWIKSRRRPDCAHEQEPGPANHHSDGSAPGHSDFPNPARQPSPLHASN